MTVCIVIAAMLSLWLFCHEFQNPRGICPVCGGHNKHHGSCPQKDRDE